MKEKNNIQLFNEDNLEVMKRLPDESIDVICIDPPYLYLKGQKLERPFDESLFFSECKRLLTQKGFIVMFGRGVSFYRWNTILADLGFEFKEEIIWNKGKSSSPVLALSRKHETISIFTQKGVINRVKIDYLEHRADKPAQLEHDLKIFRNALKKPKKIEEIKQYLNGERSEFESLYKKSKWETTVVKKSVKGNNRFLSKIKGVLHGMNEESIMYCGLSDYFKAIHPTQKPVRLLERLLALVIPKDKEAKDIVVADFFAGSMSCMEAVHHMGMQGIACEIDKEYFEAGKQRIESLQPKLAM